MRHARNRLAPRPATLAAAALATAALAASAPARAQPPDAWVLDHFEVVHTVDVHDEVETRRYTTPGSNIDAFAFGGTKVYTGTYPTGKLIATGTLSVELPDTITPGTPFQIGGGATGQVGTPGRTGQTAVTLVAYNECYIRSACPGALKSHYLDNVEGRTVDLAAPLAGQTATLPADPTQWPPLHVVMFRGTIGTTTPGDPVWRVYVYAYYRRPETVPTPAPSFRLEVDADATRLPPSGAAPSEAVVTATMTDGAGRPVAGEALQFALDPPDMGTLAPAGGTTDAAGEVRVRYRAPLVDALRGRSDVAVVVKSAARGLERRLGLRIERYRLDVKVDPAEVPIEPIWRAIKVTADVQDFDGRPVAGDVLRFSVDPPDMGTFIGATMRNNEAKTDAAGRVEAFYEPPPPSELNGREQATIRVVNVTHGGEGAAAVQFKGLKIKRTWPQPDARDVVLEPDDTVDIEFDRAIDPASVNEDTLRLDTLWHGDLGTWTESFASGAKLRVTADPVPDVGLQVRVVVKGGQDGVKGRDGSVLSADHVFRFRTMPRFDPKIIVSQVVDDPKDPLYGFITLAVKSFALRVDAGISEDSELDDEIVNVRLLVGRRNMDETVQHTFYPGRWPPKVPDAAAKRGNTANFVVKAPLGRGGYTVQAELRPAHAVPEKVVQVPPVAFNVNSWSDVGAARRMGLLAVPIVNSKEIPGFAWKVSRGQQEHWLLGLGQPAVNLLPLTRLDLRLGYLADTPCDDPDKCHDDAPWTKFLYWAQHVGRTGFLTRVYGWRYIVVLVPPGFFAQFIGHPDVIAHPEAYHEAMQSGIWAQAASAPGVPNGRSAFPIALLEVGASPEALVHVLGDIEGLPDSTAGTDRLSGYDLLNDRVIAADDTHVIGASRAVMNVLVGRGPTWPATHDYERFIDLWTERSCLGAPPCPPRFAAADDAGADADTARADDDRVDRVDGVDGVDGGDGGDGGAPVDATNVAAVTAAADPVPVWLVSGTIRRRTNGTESAAIDPVMAADGTPSLDPAGAGDYAVELRDIAGTRLARYAFTPAFGPLADGALAGYLVAVPADATAVVVAITRGNRVIAQRTRSAHPPSVRFTSPQPGATRRGDVDVAWTGDDADGDALTYTLLYSGDGGTRWEPLSMDGRLTRFSLRSADVPNGPEARLRLVASDGFNSATTTLAFGLDNPIRVLAEVPADGASGVPVRTLVEAHLRDPIHPSTLQDVALTLFDASGAVVPGVSGHAPVDHTVVFTPTVDLDEASAYWARLSGAQVLPDGQRRSAGTIHAWRFTTRGKTVFLPWSVRSGSMIARTATPRPTPTFGPPPTPRPASTATATPTQSAAATATPDAVATRVAATRTALAPTATRAASPTTVPTADAVATAVAATLTALAPTPGGGATPSATSTAVGGAAIAAGRALTTGADPAFMRMAFAPGEAVTLWLEVTNSGPAPATAEFDFTLSPDGTGTDSLLAWRGPIEVPVGTSWFQLARTVPAGAPIGRQTFRGQVTAGGTLTAATSEIVIARTLRLADDFGDPTSGWPAGQDASGAFGYLGGAYRIAHLQRSVWRWATLPNGPSLSDLAVEADVQMPGTAQGWVALVFGLNAAGSDFHIFEIDRAGQYSLYRRAAGQWQTLVPPTSSDQLAVADATNHLLLVRDAGLTTLYANGQFVSMVTDIAAPAGRVGVYASNGDAGFEGRFDNFRGYGLR